MTQTLMAQEIAEIPSSVAACLKGNAESLRLIADNLRAFDPQLVITVARGSSDHAASYFKYACEILAGIPVASVGPSVASVYNAKLRLPRTLGLAISQSGQSPDIVAMTRAARASGAITVALTNNPTAIWRRAAAIACRCIAGRNAVLRQPKASSPRWWGAGASGRMAR